MAAGEWTVDQVAGLIVEFAASPAYYAVGGLPFVSTFEGPGWAGNWAAVRAAAGGIFLVPDWSSLGPHGVRERLDVVDGAFSWAAWPRADQARMTADEDVAYLRALRGRGRAYMMGVSPWFYTSELVSAAAPRSARAWEEERLRNVWLLISSANQDCRSGTRTGTRRARASGSTGGRTS